MLDIQGAQVLLADGTVAETSLRLEAQGTLRLGGTGAGRHFDARGLFALPGIVDLHGDAFERQMQPRPGVNFPLPLALRDTEAQLLANGITTALHAVTLSWEPGLRGLENWRLMVEALEAHRPAMVCDMRLHMRWELYNLLALEVALADVEAGRVGLVSFNDHMGSVLREMAQPAGAAKYSQRSGMPVAQFRQLAEAIAAGQSDVPAATARLAAAARRHGLPMASHDDDAVAVRERFRALGARICEFPMAEAVGEDARDSGDAVVMGCPNVVRGGSHLGWASAGALAERGVCTVLCSDYFYPAMLPAAWSLGHRGALSLGQAWALVSANAAAAAGLHDRGTIEDGKRADVVLVDPAGPRVVATFAAGRVGYLSGAGWDRLH
ncbi:MAG: alpha-D-ribose 1-methylphosphonate 5-triphosphate diphosphatase [Acetobacteraceae bacterium]|nr:alpha-D-ribose 1-methylphosphonate 5-triphosphate diphosphatase [Acetobacteraceae bacterium]